MTQLQVSQWMYDLLIIFFFLFFSDSFDFNFNFNFNSNHNNFFFKKKKEMIHHCRAVARGASLPFLIGDMPFGSYQASIESAIHNATRFLKEGNMEVRF